MAKRVTKRHLNESEYKELIEDRFPQYKYISGYKNANSRIKMQHKCGNIVEYSWANLNKGSCRCPVCDPNSLKLCVGINDIGTTDEWMIPLLYDKEDAYRYKRWSDKRIKYICPICKSVSLKKISAVTAEHKVPCTICSSGTSYPERFMSSILDFLKVDYIYQFFADWSCGRKYDFCFNKDGKYYLLEMDGFFHFHDDTRKCTSKEQAQEIDKLKDRLAIENGYIIIRINCDYGNNDPMKYIIENIKQSVLSELFDLSSVDFELCNNRALKNVTIIIANLWNEGVHYIKEITNILGYNRNTVSKNLKKASIAGLIPESPEQVKEISKRIGCIECGKSQRKPVKCNETGEIFPTTSAAIKAHPGNLGRYFSGESDHSGVLSDGTKLTWTKLY